MTYFIDILYSMIILKFMASRLNENRGLMWLIVILGEPLNTFKRLYTHQVS
jgi:hypothetical protein